MIGDHFKVNHQNETTNFEGSNEMVYNAYIMIYYEGVFLILFREYKVGKCMTNKTFTCKIMHEIRSTPNQNIPWIVTFS